MVDLLTLNDMSRYLTSSEHTSIIRCNIAIDADINTKSSAYIMQPTNTLPIWQPSFDSWFTLCHFYFRKGRRLPPFLIHDILRHWNVFLFVFPCCLTPKTWVLPLELRCYLVYELRFTLSHLQLCTPPLFTLHIPVRSRRVDGVWCSVTQWWQFSIEAAAQSEFSKSSFGCSFGIIEITIWL